MTVPERNRRPNQKTATGLITLTPAQTQVLSASSGKNTAGILDIEMKTSSGIIPTYGSYKYATAVARQKKTNNGI